MLNKLTITTLFTSLALSIASYGAIATPLEKQQAEKEKNKRKSR